MDNRKQKAIAEIVRIITNWMGAGPYTVISAQSREAIYNRLFPLMGISDKKLRKLLNKAWDRGNCRRIYGWRWCDSWGKDARYRDVSKIIKAAEKPKEASNA